MPLCTLFLLINQLQDIPIALVSNRDELRSRKSSIVQGWDNYLKFLGNDNFAPRDEIKKGTWFACQNKINGKWAILTNIRDLASFNKSLKSRGDLVIKFLNDANPPFLFLEKLKKNIA